MKYLLRIGITLSTSYVSTQSYNNQYYTNILIPSKIKILEYGFIKQLINDESTVAVNIHTEYKNISLVWRSSKIPKKTKILTSQEKNICNTRGLKSLDQSLKI